jgi:hypothetical protein
MVASSEKVKTKATVTWAPLKIFMLRNAYLDN